MTARMLNNISAAMTQFYLVFVLNVVDHKPGDPPTGTSIYLAVYPLIIFLSAVISSINMGKVYRALGRKKTFTIGFLC